MALIAFRNKWLFQSWFFLDCRYVIITADVTWHIWMLTENKARSEWNNYTLCQLFANSEIKPCVCTSKHTHTHTHRDSCRFDVCRFINRFITSHLNPWCSASVLISINVTQLQLPCLSFFIIVLPAQLPCLDSSTYSTMCCMIWLWSSYKCVFFSMLYYSSITTNVTGNRTVGLTLQGYWANVSTCSYAQWNGLTSAVLFPVLIKRSIIPEGSWL